MTGAGTGPGAVMSHRACPSPSLLSRTACSAYCKWKVFRKNFTHICRVFWFNFIPHKADLIGQMTKLVSHGFNMGIILGLLVQANEWTLEEKR